MFDDEMLCKTPLKYCHSFAPTPEGIYQKTFGIGVNQPSEK